MTRRRRNYCKRGTSEAIRAAAARPRKKTLLFEKDLRGAKILLFADDNFFADDGMCALNADEIRSGFERGNIQ